MSTSKSRRSVARKPRAALRRVWRSGFGMAATVAVCLTLGWLAGRHGVALVVTYTAALVAGVALTLIGWRMLRGELRRMLRWWTRR